MPFLGFPVMQSSTFPMDVMQGKDLRCFAGDNCLLCGATQRLKSTIGIQ